MNFYDAPLIILTRRVPPVPTNRFSAFMKFESDAFSLGNNVSELKTLPIPSEKLLGRCIPKPALLGPVDDVEKAVLELLDKSRGSRFFIASEWEVPSSTPAPKPAQGDADIDISPCKIISSKRNHS